MTQQEGSSNGWLVRFVGRNRIHDGDLHILASLLFPFPLLISIVMGVYKGRPLRDILFQCFGIGNSDYFRLKLPKLPSVCDPKKLRFVFISDTHMCHEQLSVHYGDVLIHSGDFTNHGSFEEIKSFTNWLKNLPHRIKIVVPGNHDMLLDSVYYTKYWRDWSHVRESSNAAFKVFSDAAIHLLIDSGIDIGSVKI